MGFLANVNLATDTVRKVVMTLLANCLRRAAEAACRQTYAHKVTFSMRQYFDFLPLRIWSRETLESQKSMEAYSNSRHKCLTNLAILPNG